MSYQNSQFEIRFATENDDAELLAILEESPMPGSIQLLYTRRPSPWRSFHREGQEVGIMICRDKNMNCIVSLGVYAIKEMYINQEVRRVAYLFSLRSLQKYRLKFPLREGYEFLREQVQKQNVAFIFTSIIEKNTYSIKLFSKKHIELPVYQNIFSYSTLCLNQSKVINKAQNKNKIRQATIDDAEDVCQFILTSGCQLNGYPKIDKSDLLNSSSQKYILNFYLCRNQDNKIEGIMSLCNPHSDKQYIVVNYSWQIKVYNFIRNFLPIEKLPKFPRLNQSVEYAFIAHWLLSKVDNQMLVDLISFICINKRPIPFLLIGLPTTSPYYEMLNQLSYFNYKSNIYQVKWENMPEQTVPVAPYYLECYSL
jgi:hypothetical protein